jgi:aryl-alcohol dehydrogenase-like predicted oxidoreductase
MVQLIGTDLDPFPLVLGGNVFGWTADERQSFAVLDAFVDAGGTMIDTADSYTAWVPGNSGGESEALIGRWLASRGVRDRVLLATKVSRHPQARGLAAQTIRRGVEASLRRLRTDRIDLYYAHYDDPDVPQEETLGAFDTLITEGSVRYLGASNFTAHRLSSALKIADANGWNRYVALQPHYNLMERGYERDLAPVVAAERLSVLPYYGLARGFLTGKYRDDRTVDGPRAEGARAYLTDRGRRVLAVLDDVAAGHGVRPAAVALAWLRSRTGVTAPIASARTPEQLAELLPAVELRLTGEELDRLTAASD